MIALPKAFAVVRYNDGVDQLPTLRRPLSQLTYIVVVLH